MIDKSESCTFGESDVFIGLKGYECGVSNVSLNTEGSYYITHNSVRGNVYASVVRNFLIE
jgi:hypothetical protein